MTKPVKPITVQKLHAVLRKAGLERYRWISGRHRKSGHYQDGYRIESRMRTIAFWDWKISHFEVSHRAIQPQQEPTYLAKYATTLQSAGIACEIRDGAVVVPVEQGEGQT